MMGSHVDQPCPPFGELGLVSPSTSFRINKAEPKGWLMNKDLSSRLSYGSVWTPCLTYKTKNPRTLKGAATTHPDC